MANSSHRIQGHDARCAGEDRQSPAHAPAHRWHSTWGHQRGNRCVHTLGQRSLLLLVLLWLDPRTGGCPVAAQRRALKGGGGMFRHFDCPQQKGPETDPYFVSLLDYDGVLDGRGHRPCSDLFLRRTQALQCKVLQQPSWWHAAPISAEVCNLPGGDVLVSILTPTDMNAWFHAHLVGPQVMSPPLSTCSLAVRTEGPGMDMVRNANSYHAAAMFSPQDVEVDAKGSIRKRAAAHQLLVTDVIPGDYELSLRVVYLNFSYSRDRNTTAEGACGDPVWRIPLQINATTGSGCTYCAPQPQSWPVCSSPTGEGTVLFTKRDAGLQIPETMGRSWSLWRDTLQWQPKGCNFVPREKIDLPQCFKDRMVCFVGDSHMRYAHNGVVDALNDQGWREANTTGFHGIFEHNNTRLVWNVWAEMPRFDRGKMFEGCTDIIMGFAAWPLGKPPAYRWTAGHYVQMMTESFQWASNWLAQNPSRRAYFMPTSLHRILCDNPLELRNPPYVRLFNQLSMMLAGLHRIPVIDTETITGAMFDLAHDDVHHHWIGFSGHTIVDFILNVLCVQQKPQLR